MPKWNMVNIDAEALKEELKKKGLGLSVASFGIGRSASYLGGAIKKGGLISGEAATALEKVYGIKKGTFVLGVKNERKEDKGQKGEQKKEEQKEQAFDYNKLYEVIYTAVYHACKKATEDAWKEA